MGKQRFIDAAAFEARKAFPHVTDAQARVIGQRIAADPLFEGTIEAGAIPCPDELEAHVQKHARAAPELVRPTPTVEDVLEHQCNEHAARFEVPADGAKRMEIFRSVQAMTPDERIASVPHSVKRADTTPALVVSTPPSSNNGKVTDNDLRQRFGIDFTDPMERMNRARQILAERKAGTNVSNELALLRSKPEAELTGSERLTLHRLEEAARRGA